MSMPKGYKSENGYASVNDISGALDYRTIAKKMTDSGDKMNHATARNVFLRAMAKFAKPINEMYESQDEQRCVDQMSRDPRFQAGILELVECVYNDDVIDI